MSQQSYQTELQERFRDIGKINAQSAEESQLRLDNITPKAIAEGDDIDAFREMLDNVTRQLTEHQFSPLIDNQNISRCFANQNAEFVDAGLSYVQNFVDSADAENVQNQESLIKLVEEILCNLTNFDKTQLTSTSKHLGNAFTKFTQLQTPLLLLLSTQLPYQQPKLQMLLLHILKANGKVLIGNQKSDTEALLNYPQAKELYQNMFQVHDEVLEYLIQNIQYYAVFAGAKNLAKFIFETQLPVKIDLLTQEIQYYYKILQQESTTIVKEALKFNSAEEPVIENFDFQLDFRQQLASDYSGTLTKLIKIINPYKEYEYENQRFAPDWFAELQYYLDLCDKEIFGTKLSINEIQSYIPTTFLFLTNLFQFCPKQLPEATLVNFVSKFSQSIEYLQDSACYSQMIRCLDAAAFHFGYEKFTNIYIKQMMKIDYPIITSNNINDILLQRVKIVFVESQLTLAELFIFFIQSQFYNVLQAIQNSKVMEEKYKSKNKLVDLLVDKLAQDCFISKQVKDFINQTNECKYSLFANFKKANAFILQKIIKTILVVDNSKQLFSASLFLATQLIHKRDISQPLLINCKYLQCSLLIILQINDYQFDMQYLQSKEIQKQKSTVTIQNEDSVSQIILSQVQKTKSSISKKDDSQDEQEIIYDDLKQRSQASKSKNPVSKSQLFVRSSTPLLKQSTQSHLTTSRKNSSGNIQLQFCKQYNDTFDTNTRVQLLLELIDTITDKTKPEVQLCQLFRAELHINQQILVIDGIIKAIDKLFTVFQPNIVRFCTSSLLELLSSQKQSIVSMAKRVLNAFIIIEQFTDVKFSTKNNIFGQAFLDNIGANRAIQQSIQYFNEVVLSNIGEDKQYQPNNFIRQLLQYCSTEKIPELKECNNLLNKRFSFQKTTQQPDTSDPQYQVKQQQISEKTKESLILSKRDNIIDLDQKLSKNLQVSEIKTKQLQSPKFQRTPIRKNELLQSNLRVSSLRQSPANNSQQRMLQISGFSANISQNSAPKNKNTIVKQDIKFICKSLGSVANVDQLRPLSSVSVAKLILSFTQKDVIRKVSHVKYVCQLLCYYCDDIMSEQLYSAFVDFLKCFLLIHEVDHILLFQTTTKVLQLYEPVQPSQIKQISSMFTIDDKSLINIMRNTRSLQTDLTTNQILLYLYQLSKICSSTVLIGDQLAKHSIIFVTSLNNTKIYQQSHQEILYIITALISHYKMSSIQDIQLLSNKLELNQQQHDVLALLISPFFEEFIPISGPHIQKLDMEMRSSLAIINEEIDQLVVHNQQFKNEIQNDSTDGLMTKSKYCTVLTELVDEIPMNMMLDIDANTAKLHNILLKAQTILKQEKRPFLTEILQQLLLNMLQAFNQIYAFSKVHDCDFYAETAELILKSGKDIVNGEIFRLIMRFHLKCEHLRSKQLKKLFSQLQQSFPPSLQIIAILQETKLNDQYYCLDKDHVQSYLCFYNDLYCVLAKSLGQLRLQYFLNNKGYMQELSDELHKFEMGGTENSDHVSRLISVRNTVALVVSEMKLFMKADAL